MRLPICYFVPALIHKDDARQYSGISLVGLAFCTVFKRLPPHQTHCRLERLGRRSAGPQDWTYPARLKSRHRPRRVGIRIAAEVSRLILSHRARVFLARQAAGPGLSEENVGNVEQSTLCPWACPHLQVLERIECFSRRAPTDGPCRDKDGKPPPAEFDWHHTAQWEKDCEIKVKPVPPTSV